jgi:hypothetical protein
MPKLPYPKYKPRRKGMPYVQPRNPSGKRTPAFVKLRLSNYKKKPFFG